MGRRNIKLSENIIDFDDYQEKSEEEVREKILEIIKKEDSDYEESSVCFLKNINKIAKTEVKELLSTLLGKESNANSWIYKKKNQQQDGTIEEIDAIPYLSKFVFITSSNSNSNSEELKDLRKNFRIVEEPLSENKLTVFILSGGL